MKTFSFLIMSALFLSFGLCQKQDKTDSSYFLPETSFTIEIDEDKPSVLYFGATWCSPCKITKRNLESKEVKKELQRFNFKMYDVDVDKKEKEKYRIKLVPTIIVLKDSKTYRYIGGKSITELIKILKKY
jgi:thiol-disulfide isomerase/thioredoxin